ncbi:hypothetical protein PO909_033327 [Leuciscus waleckii]
MGKKQADTGPLSRRPDNSAFKQQRLPAWSPSLTAQTVLPTFYILSLVCLFLGVWLLITVQKTHELKVRQVFFLSSANVQDSRKWGNRPEGCVPLETRSTQPTNEFTVFLKCDFMNFHQNLRRYMDSRDDAQMVGRKNNLKAPSSYCAPFDYGANKVPVAPCGAVANSMFNDSFTVIYYPTNEPEVQVPLYRKGIAWYTDKNVKFRNPPTNNTFTLRQAFEGTIRPLYWQRPVYELDDTDSNNNGFINDDLIVWMREAAFPNFKKLYGVLNRAQGPFNQGLPSGNYSISIIYSILCSWRTELVVNGRKGFRQH